ncbi:MAG: 4'-phosphopantetheinyl transferase superfamily protein [Salinimicrobium sp.]
MIGNDVVDLQLAARQSDWRRNGFLEKVFSAEERLQISAAKDPEKLVWLFWSMKEAAYKAHQRRCNLPRKLNWQDFSCSLNKIGDCAASGVVRIAESEFFTASEIARNYIYTSAEASELRGVKNGIFETSSAEMKQLFLQEISEVYKLPREQLQLEKNTHGIPFVAYRKMPFFEGFSFSGHGRYCAFSMAVNDL